MKKIVGYSMTKNNMSKYLTNREVINELLKFLTPTNRARLRATSKGVRAAVNKNAGYTSPASSPKRNNRSPPPAPKKKRSQN